MIAHPLLQPKQGASHTSVANFAQELATREPDILLQKPSPYQKSWVVVMSVYALIAVLAFMLVPVITLTFGESTTNFIENIKDLVNFGAPTLLLVAVLVGATGYYGYSKIAWWLSFGFWISIVVLVINIVTGVNWLDFGIFWIIIGTLVGLFIGCTFELISIIRHHREHFLVVLLSVGMLATAAAAVVAIQNGTRPSTSEVTLAEAQSLLAFQLFEPQTIPDRYSYFEPRLFVLNGEFHIYYGEDNYPPPPVIDFLKGLEIVEAESMGRTTADELSTYARVLVNGNEALYRETRGRSVLEWTQNLTTITLISHSSINGKELLDLARSLTPVVP